MEERKSKANKICREYIIFENSVKPGKLYLIILVGTLFLFRRGLKRLLRIIV